MYINPPNTIPTPTYPGLPIPSPPYPPLPYPTLPAPHLALLCFAIAYPTKPYPLHTRLYFTHLTPPYSLAQTIPYLTILNYPTILYHLPYVNILLLFNPPNHTPPRFILPVPAYPTLC